jgi:predicted RNA-binding protein with TRAM domain
MSFGQRGGYNRGGFGGGGSSSTGGFRSFKPKPVEVGKEYDVTISDVSRRGDGIAEVDGFVIFVAGAKQGQTVRIKVTQVSNRFASGQLVEGSMATASSEDMSSEEEESTEESTEQ